MNKWKLKDVILMAILGVVFAAIYLAVFNGGMVISTALTPLGLSAFGFELIYGVWFMAATLAAYIIRKPGVALLTEILASVVELLMGNSGGLTVVLTGFIQGLGAEVIFACFRYKKWNLLSMSLASMLSALFIFCYELYYLSSGTDVKKLLILLSPILLAAVGMFFTGYRFSAGEGMPVNSADMILTGSHVWNGLIHASRVLAFAGGGCLYCLTTDRVLMIRSFQRQFHLPQIFAYGLLAAWGVFPHMMQEYRRTRAAFRARGKNPFPVSPAFLKPLLVKSVRWSEALAVAMESKGFDGHEARSDFEPVRVRWFDGLFCAVCAALCAVMLVAF